MYRLLDVATSFAASVARFGAGMQVAGPARRPEQPFELYEFEACPYCRKVREALSMLDLDVVVYPCPKGAARHRAIVRARGGREQFPFLVDPNTGASLYESDDIIRYLFRTYGDSRIPMALTLPLVTDVSSFVASAWRLGGGQTYRPARTPEQPLELWSFEASPYCRIAREALCELELPYRLHNVGKGGAGREAFVARSGKMMVPFLHDPNTGRELFESAAIVEYLHTTYGATP